MVITVPGIEVVEDDKDAKATNRKPNKRKVPKDFEEAPDEDAKTTEKDKKGKTEKDNKKEPAKPKAKAKAKQEGTVKEAEAAARTVVLQIQRASQTVERLQAALHGEQWAAPLMKEFDSLQAALKMQVTPTDGDDLGEFVSELKLAVFSGTGASSTKTLKKDYKDRYLPLLTMFKDRCQGAAQQMLDLANKMDNMFKAVSMEADANPKGSRKSALKKRTRSESNVGGSFSSV
ncbi:unnamed protein product [Symbiodinium sp. CCMP2592]|nr:unnamed protein product [Symbiodinium sp. CCMP2592]